MADVAALNLAVKSDSIAQANVELRAMAPAASAAERAAQKWGLTTTAAARSTEDFSKRVRRTINDLEFERQQLTRTTEAKERYAILKRAGVAEASAEGRAIMASVAALQAQRAANAAAAASTRAAGSEIALLTRFLGPAAVAFLALNKVQQIWAAGMKAGDLGEQAEQIGVNTAQLQAYRFAGAQAGIETEQMDTALTKLAKSMGAAADGGKEQIELFDRLGVKLLDARGELRPVAEVLPEVARGVLAIGSSSQRTATLMELFGRSGAKMTTVLEEIAQGNDAVVAKARAAGVVLDADVIAAWDRVSDAMVKAQLAADTTYAKLGAPIATAGLEVLEKLLKSINGVMNQINSKEGFWASILEESRSKGRIGSGPNALRLETAAERNARLLAEKQKELGSPAAQGREAIIQAEIDRLNRQGLIDRQAGMESAEETARRGRLPAMAPASGGARNPVPKSSGTDPYAKAVEGAKEYVLSKKAEAEAVGQTVLAASRLKHEQDLLNKATSEGRMLSDAQKAALKDLAGQMAEADNALAKAKYLDDTKTKSEEFIAQQQLEIQTIGMSAEATARLKYETQMLNDARRQGIELTPAEIETIRQRAGAMASVEEQNRREKEWYETKKSAFKGFFTDMKSDLMQGASFWDALGKAAMNALDKITDKLLDMALSDLFDAAFGGGKGGGGSGGGILDGLFGGGSTGTSPGIFDGIMSMFNFFPTFAHGAAFRGGDVVPFAGGGVVSSPTFFPMSRGRTGLMGEAGEEGILPLRRRNGRLGVEASGVGASGQVIVTVTGDTDLVRVAARDEAGRAIAVVAPAIEARAVSKAGDQVVPRMERNERERGGEYRV